jgi:hypothetical protein
LGNAGEEPEQCVKCPGYVRTNLCHNSNEIKQTHLESYKMFAALPTWKRKY